VILGWRVWGVRDCAIYRESWLRSPMIALRRPVDDQHLRTGRSGCNLKTLWLVYW
jgi:hypothetical protein